MRLEVAGLAARYGLRLRHTVSERGDRMVAQVEDATGRLFAFKVDAEAGALAGDVASVDQLGRAGLPVPEISTYRAGPPSVLVLGWIDGHPISSADPIDAQQEAGRFLRAVHELPGNPPFSGQACIKDWITAWTEEIATWWPTVGGTTEQVTQLTGRLTALAPVLATRTGTLTLFDGRPEHILVRDDHVVGMIDLHDVGSGDPAMDLAVLTLTDEDLLPAVSKGYAADRTEQHLHLLLIPFYRLLRRLAGAEWHLQMGDRTKGEHLLHQAVTSLESCGGGWHNQNSDTIA